MSEATPFKALGVGNGFPFCVEKIDVSDYDDWLTLGGTRKGSAPTEAEIRDSMKNASKLFWNLETISMYSEGVDNTLGAIRVEDLTIPVEPRERVCANESDDYEDGKVDFVTEEPPDPDAKFMDVEIRSRLLIVKFYDGSIDDEDNFVGYGTRYLNDLAGDPEVFARAYARTSGYGTKITWMVSYDAGNFSGSSTKTVTSLSGIPFIKVVYGSDDSDAFGSMSNDITGLVFYDYA